MLHEAKASPGTVNIYAAAIRFLFAVTLKRPEVVADLVRLKTPMHLPRVLCGTEVEGVFAAIQSLASIRSSRCSCTARAFASARSHSLEVGDIDAKRMVLLIRNAKRGRERYVMLSPRCFRLCGRTGKVRGSRGRALFPGRDPSKPLTEAVQQALE